MWRSDLSNSLTPQEWASFDLALQEFKLQIMMSGQATGGEAINAAVREKIDGRKLLEVMQEGIQIRLKRIKADKAELEQAIQTNSRMRIKPGDDEKAKELADFQQSLAKKLAKMTEDVAATETVLKELETKSAEPAK